MARLTITCPYCKTIAEVESEKQIGDYVSRKFKCGHAVIDKLVISQVSEESEDSSLTTILQNALFPYQKEGREFIETSNFRMLLADDMGLGKTIQALAALERAGFTKYVIICKSSLSYNWFREFNKWMRPDFPRPILHKERYMPLPGFNGYILSMDCIASKEVQLFLKNFQPDILIVDEAHNFKNPQSDRTNALRAIIDNTKHVLLLSGTPLLNRLSEYWTILNMLRPDHWPSLRSFQFNWVEYDSNTKRYLGILPWRRQEFQDRTKGYILRRTKSQVALQLPELFDCFEYTADMSAPLKKQYAKVLQQLEDKLAETNGKMADNIMSLLQKLWSLAGLAKVPFIVDQALDFLQNTDSDRKLCIGIHHHDTCTFITALLQKAGYNPIVITGLDSAQQKETKEQQFRLPGNRVCVMSILAGGEGRNMQFCDTAFLAEQYWVPAKIEQFKGRFHRVGSTSQAVSIVTFLLRDSIEDYFQQLLELKTKIANTALTNETGQVYEGHDMMDLAKKVLSTRNKYA